MGVMAFYTTTIPTAKTASSIPISRNLFIQLCEMPSSDYDASVFCCSVGIVVRYPDSQIGSCDMDNMEQNVSFLYTQFALLPMFWYLQVLCSRTAVKRATPCLPRDVAPKTASRLRYDICGVFSFKLVYHARQAEVALSCQPAITNGTRCLGHPTNTIAVDLGYDDMCFMVRAEAADRSAAQPNSFQTRTQTRHELAGDYSVAERER
ncbi:hypothetical protein FHL15_000719 [Xylaria flabelliformis]|uniref:Uncharacterized protein n=1 Tax=Xylaria flabelliformis TaxID=2512241 RepID=A0A553IEL0_9PEZI|nr:hypothetical protein FHL15_000719 [Xylaria flabelliformis]